MPTIGEIYRDDYVKRQTAPFEARIAELEAALRQMHAAVPGGGLADPQRIADDLREIAARVGVDVGN